MTRHCHKRKQKHKNCLFYPNGKNTELSTFYDGINLIIRISNLLLKNFIGVKMFLKLTNNAKSFLDKKTFSKGREILAYTILKKIEKDFWRTEFLRFLDLGFYGWR